MSVIALDPLIAEAKQRAHRRHVLLAGLAVAALAAAGVTTTLETRVSDASTGICATPPSGFKQRTVSASRRSLPTVVLTNFRFGRMSDNFGLVTAVPHPRPGLPTA